MFARSISIGTLLVLLLGCGGPAPAPDGMQIILITMDTTRADRLSCYGYEKETSPNLDAFALESTMYTQAYSSSSWTLPAHASLFTAKFPTSHGARYDPEGPLKLTAALDGPEAWNQYSARGLATDETTLAQMLGDEGFATGAVVSGPWLKQVFGLDLGFDHWDDEGIDHLNGKPAAQVTDSAIEWIRDHRSNKFLLFLNYYDPHLPYMPPIEYRDAFYDGTITQQVAGTTIGQNALYDAEILYMDHHIGRLFENLRSMGLYDDAWIIVTADHGDLLGEHGRFGHGETLTEEEIHIPLLIKYPKAAATGKIDGRVQITDIMPTILERLGLPIPESTQGSTLTSVTHPIVAEVYPVPFVSENGDWVALYEGDFKYLWNSKGANALFNLKRDADEKENLSLSMKKRSERMRKTVQGYLDSLPEPGDAGPVREVDAETQKMLENMGYLKTPEKPSDG